MGETPTWDDAGSAAIKVANAGSVTSEPAPATLDDVVRALNRLADAMLKLVDAQSVAMDKPATLPPTPPVLAVAPHRRNQ